MANVFCTKKDKIKKHYRLKIKTVFKSICLQFVGDNAWLKPLSINTSEIDMNIVSIPITEFFGSNNLAKIIPIMN